VVVGFGSQTVAAGGFCSANSLGSIYNKSVTDPLTPKSNTATQADDWGAISEKLKVIVPPKPPVVALVHNKFSLLIKVVSSL